MQEKDLRLEAWERVIEETERQEWERLTRDTVREPKVREAHERIDVQEPVET